MSGEPGPCPSTEEIGRVADGGEVPPELARHVGDCVACRAKVESMRDDARFLGRVRTLAAPTLAPRGLPRIPGFGSLVELSSGAQGVVYRAVQESTSRTVAIKILAGGETASARQRARAEREAEIAARLRHPNIVTVYESRRLSDGRIAVVMEFVDGVRLDEWRPGGDRPAREELLRTFATVCGAIHHAHLNGVIHRDVKPENVMVTGEGRPVVLDFGIAKAGGLRTTLTGEFAGTPAYASPEQASGRGDDVDALTDVYSLGVILYKLVCRAMPYELEGSIFDMARTIAQTPPVPPRRHDAAIAADLEAIILRALQKDKAQRYESAAALARDVERFLAGDPVEARSGSGWYLLRKAVSVNRRRLAWAGVGALVLVGAGAAVILSLASAAESSRHAAEQRERARAESVRSRAVSELLRDALPSAELANPELAGVVGAGLGRLYYRLESGAFRDDPEVDQTLRRLWGQVYTGLGGGRAAGFIEFSEDSLRNGLIRLRQQHGAEHPEIAASMHDLANVLLVRRRAPEAERVCREALAMRERLVGAESAASAETRALLAKILAVSGREDEALKEADRALTVLRGLPAREADLLIASMDALKGRALLRRSDPACEPPIREALVNRLRRQRTEEPELLGSLQDGADVAAAFPASALGAMMASAWGAPADRIPALVRADARCLGEPDRGDYQRVVQSGRTAALGRLITLAGGLLGERDPAIVGLLISRIRAGEGERELEIQIACAVQTADILSHMMGSNDLSVLMYVEQAAVLQAYAGRPGQAVELGRRACEIWDSIPVGARDMLLAANSRQRLAQYLAMDGQAGAAMEELRRSMAEIETAVGAEHRCYALAECMMAYCQGEAGDLAAADVTSARALALAERLPATPPDQLAHNHFVRGHVLRELGRAEEARTHLSSAWEMFYHLATLPYPWRKRCMEDLVSACEMLHDAEGAATWRRQMDIDPTLAEPVGASPADAQNRG